MLPEILMALLKGVFVALVALLILVFIAAVAISNGLLKQDSMTGIVLVCTLLSSLFGGIYTLSSVKKQFFLLGVAVGLILFVVLLFLGLCFYQNVSVLHGGSEILLASLCGGAMAKLFSKQKKKSSKFTKKS